jgi:DNA-binding Lrp family transcriptional regulator
MLYATDQFYQNIPCNILGWIILRVDNIDLQIVRLLARDSRTHYNNIASAVGITPSAAKKRINKMISNGVIRGFAVVINPVIFGYEKECILIIKNIGKTINEQDIFKKVSLLGDVFLDFKQLEQAAALIILFVRKGAEDKIRILTDLLKPAEVESIFGSLRPVTMRIHSSDLEIMKCLLSDPHMPVEDIAKETSLSRKTVAKRLDKMRENHVLQFSIVANLSSMNVTGYIEFGVLIRVHAAYHQNVVQRIYNEMQEYMLHPLDELPQYPINYSISYRREVVIASFCCANISTINLILRRLESYDGVNKVEPITVTSGRIYQDWLRNEIDKRIISQKYSSLPSSASPPSAATTNDR